MFLVFCLCSFSFEGQEFISVILVLLSALFYFGGETLGEVGGEGVEAVKDRDNALLLYQRWYRDNLLFYFI